MDRRRFIGTTAAAAAIAGCGKAGKARAAGHDRPNVLVILDDQERAPMHGLPYRTPNRDRLRPHAVEFTSAYCAYPLCSPSRAAIFTGRYPHDVGILTNVDFALNNPSLSRSVPNLASVFGSAGYRTAYFGKWHLSHKAHGRENPRRYGFAEVRVGNQLMAYGSDPDITGYASRWIEHNKDQAPWLAVYSPINPHDICFQFLDKYYGGARDYDVDLPPNLENGKAPAIKAVSDFKEWFWTKNVIPADRAGWEKYLRYYCFLIEAVDREVGKVLGALEVSGQSENTVVVFTSDHGEMAGSHGLVHKGHTMYEENLRIPLWIADPRHVSMNRACDAMVSNIDLAPTLSGLAGIKWPAPLPGIDLSPVVRDEPGNETGHDHIFSEGALRLDTCWRGVRTRDWKYFHYTTGEELLFNLKNDPLEMKNLAPDNNASDVLASFRAQVRNWRRETNDPVKGFME
ncbi:MAG TPA: sulfatase-like hydrolase/transferase [bacterium]|nr:sulfatase-like hydrolase/transferase [bacterium]